MKSRLDIKSPQIVRFSLLQQSQPILCGNIVVFSLTRPRLLLHVLRTTVLSIPQLRKKAPIEYNLATHRRTNLQLSIKPFFEQPFIRNSYFFVYTLQLTLTESRLSSKVGFFQSNYSFVNTTFLKRLIIRRVVRDTFYFKNTSNFNRRNFLRKPFYDNSIGSLNNTKGPLNSGYALNKPVLSTHLNSKITRIPRIRFKPGYARQWRFFRSDVKNFLHIKTRYQYRLTTLLQRLYYSKKKSLN